MSPPESLVHRTAAARDGQPPHPALLLLHGRGSNEVDLLPMAAAFDPRLFVVSARAPHPYFGGFRWYEQDDSGQQNRASFEMGLELLGRFVDDMLAAYPIDPGQLYLLGFSQGAMMSNALTLTVPHKVAGAVLLSGFPPPLENAAIHGDELRGKPFFVAHGTEDPLLGIELGREVRDTLTALQADVTYREYPMAHQVVQPELEEIQAWLARRLKTASSPS
jgi:phospholipase/carboxylesterase